MMAAGPYGSREPGMGGGPPRMPPPQHHQHGYGQVPPNGNGAVGYGGGPPGPGGGGTRPPTVDLRLIFNRDEVAYLFGFDGVLLNQLAQQTSAVVNMNPGECLEYVVSISGTIEIIFKAFSLVCRKLWDFWTNIVNPGQQLPLVIRMAVHVSQCGSIIGKQGSKIKEIREMSGANIQVFQENLPESNERCVEIVGTGETCLQCVYHICNVLLEAPARSDLKPYIPKSRGGPGWGPPDNMDNWKPVFLCGDKAYIIDGMRARPAPPELLRRELSKTPLGGHVADTLAAQQQQQPGVNVNSKSIPDYMNPLNLMAAISSSHKTNASEMPKPRTSKEMIVSYEMMLHILRQSNGAKLEEIHRMSGAQIHVPGEDEVRPSGEIPVTISGTEESILLAQFLIQSHIDLAAKEMQQHSGFRGFPPNMGPGPEGGFNSNYRQPGPPIPQQHGPPGGGGFHGDPRGFGGGPDRGGFRGGGPPHRGRGGPPMRGGMMRGSWR